MACQIWFGLSARTPIAPFLRLLFGRDRFNPHRLTYLYQVLRLMDKNLDSFLLLIDDTTNFREGKYSDRFFLERGMQLLNGQKFVRSWVTKLQQHQSRETVRIQPIRLKNK